MFVLTLRLSYFVCVLFISCENILFYVKRKGMEGMGKMVFSCSKFKKIAEISCSSCDLSLYFLTNTC